MSRFAFTRRSLLASILAGVTLVPALPVSAQEAPQRIVSIGGAVTEIVFALNQQHRLVARDTTSVYPAEAELLPDVGYIRQLSPEGVLSVRPDMILTEDGAGPPEAVELLQHAGLPFVVIPQGYDGATILAKIRAVGAALGVPAEAEALAARTRTALEEATAGEGAAGKRVLFVLSVQGGRIMASGTGTAADGIIRMAGAENAIGDFPGYKMLTDEAITAAAPDVILLMENGGGDHAALPEKLLAMPAVAATPAGQARAFVSMDGMYLLGFSVRTPDAVRDLVAALTAAPAAVAGN